MRLPDSHHFVLALFVFANGACHWDGVTAPETATIRAFAGGQGVIPIHALETLVQFNQPRIVVFRLEWGPPLQGDIGCIACPPRFAKQTGLMLEQRIGWLDSRPGSEVGQLFDFVATDTVLTSSRMFGALAAADELLFHHAYAPMLARDPDTPLPGLREVAKTLTTRSSPGIAELLLVHPVASRDCEILARLSDLPSRSDDVYGAVRVRAQALLDAQCASQVSAI